MKVNLGIDNIDTSLRTKIKLYKKRAKEIEQYLSKHPDEWGKFQNEFNAEIDGVFRKLLIFEKNNIINGNEDKAYKLKQFFINNFRDIFVNGDYLKWSLEKPYGYAGDFKIINDIYLNHPKTNGFDRLFDNYYQMSSICIAVRNRKEDFKRFLLEFAKKRTNCKLSIMDIASGPCRDIKELLDSEKKLFKNTVFNCYDNDENSIKFAKNLLMEHKNIAFYKENALRLALKKDITSDITKKYDCIYSTGLFDYFDEKVSTRLVRNLKKLLKPKGQMFIATVRDKYSNPSVYFMEWVADWNLVYRDEKEFKRIFITAGFIDDKVKIKYEQQGIIQYIIACQ